MNREDFLQLLLGHLDIAQAHPKSQNPARSLYVAAGPRILAQRNWYHCDRKWTGIHLSCAVGGSVINAVWDLLSEKDA